MLQHPQLPEEMVSTHGLQGTKQFKFKLSSEPYKTHRCAIIVRHFKSARIDEFLRITVGTPEQCGALVDALGEILRAGT